MHLLFFFSSIFQHNISATRTTAKDVEDVADAAHLVTGSVPTIVDRAPAAERRLRRVAEVVTTGVRIRTMPRRLRGP